MCAGHSLGGAVAQLCALRLLHDLPPYLVEQGRVKCISFAAPPVGNSALANTVSYKGWSGLFYNLALPGMNDAMVGKHNISARIPCCACPEDTIPHSGDCSPVASRRGCGAAPDGDAKQCQSASSSCRSHAHAVLREQSCEQPPGSSRRRGSCRKSR